MTISWIMHFCIDSSPGETLEDLAKMLSTDKTPAGRETYFNAMLEQNKTEHWAHDVTTRPRFPLPPGSIVCLPNPEDLKAAKYKTSEAQRLRQALLSALHYHNRQTVTTRQRAITAVKHYPTTTLSAISRLTEAFHSLSDHKEALLGMGGGLLTVGEQYQDFVKDSAKEMRVAMLETQNKLDFYRKAAYGEKTAAKQAFIEAHRKVKRLFEEYLKRYGETYTTGMKKLAFVNNRERWLKQSRTDAASAQIIDTEAYKSVVRTMKVARYAGTSFIALDVGLGAAEVYQTYREGGDWFEELLEDMAGLIGSLAGGSGAVFLVERILMLTPEGWVIILIGTVGALTLAEYFKIITKKTIHHHKEHEHVL